MREEYGWVFFLAIVIIAITSFTFIVISDGNKTRIATVKKCEDAGWTWFAVEEKCIMVKEVK